MDERIEAFLQDVLALEGDISHLTLWPSLLVFLGPSMLASEALDCNDRIDSSHVRAAISSPSGTWNATAPPSWGADDGPSVSCFPHQPPRSGVARPALLRNNG